MSKVRALIVALVVVLVAGVAALLLGIGYRSGLAVHLADHQDVALNGNLAQLYDDPTTSQQLVRQAAAKLEDVYYRPVDQQNMVQGEQKALLAYLKSKHVANAQVPLTSGNDAPFTTMLAYAEQHYGTALGAHADQDLTESALRGIMNSVNDPYTVYLSPKDMQQLSEQLNGGNFGGIGVYIGQTRNGDVVVVPIADMPAAHAGVKPGDVVLAVNGTSVKNVSLDRVEGMIRGPEGTQVRLTTHPQESAAQHTVTITRQIIHVPTVESKVEAGYDYIRLSDFGQTSADEIRKALVAGKAKGAKGVILDLRNNGGGFLEAAVAISSYFIPSGTIVSTIDRDGNQDVQKAQGDTISGLGPLVVLVNKYTASASEITSGALQDYHAGTIIGTKTFGKGVVQSIYQLRDGGALKITTARYVTPNGRDIQHKGIQPDIVIDQNVDPSLIDTKGDKQLAAAKAQLRKLLR